MRLQIWFNSLFFVALVLQDNSSAEGGPKANLTALQEKVEKLIETVMIAIQEYYQESEREYKCLPEKYTEELMNAVKDGIDCVEQNHKKYVDGHIDLQEHRKEFLKCFAKAKNTVEYVLQNLDPGDNNCPPEMVEKTFQINVTTSYTKTFNLNIQNGVKVVYNKTIQVTRNEEPCRNYPDVFSYDEKPGRIQEIEMTANGTSGILHHNLGSKSGLEGSGTKHIVTDELPTSRSLGSRHEVKIMTPGMGHLKQMTAKDETAYAYFQEFQNTENTKDRSERSGEREILRKIRKENWK